MRQLRLELGDRSYEIAIGRDLDAGRLDSLLAGRPAVALVDANVAALQGPLLDARLGNLPRLTVPPGESSKSLAMLETLAESLLELGLGRDGVLVAVGGGVCGDLCGFLAASYLRGIPFVQMPTTLLAQVDASVGGKVAVNLRSAKNSLGTFLQPLGVISELAFLDTLPRRELAAGLAEIAKMAAIMDPDLLDLLEKEGEGLLDASASALPGLIESACALKAAVVVEDEREVGPREILNFGHTVAHALEGQHPKPDLLHGEAVAIGMGVALGLGVELGLTSAERAARLDRILSAWKLPCRIPGDLAASALRSAMGADKKNRGRKLRFVLIEDWGRPRRGVEIEEDLLARVLVEYGAAREKR